MTSKLESKSRSEWITTSPALNLFRFFCILLKMELRPCQATESKRLLLTPSHFAAYFDLDSAFADLLHSNQV